MTTKTWTFDLDGKQHTLELEHDTIRGRKTIHIDGELRYEHHEPISRGSEHPFEIDGHEVVALIKPKGSSFAYDVLVDDRSLETGKHRIKVDHRLLLGLQFVVLFGVVIISIGGYLALFSAPGIAQEAQRIRNMPEYEVADLGLAKPAEELVFTGILGGIPGSGPDLQVDVKAAAYRLVIYEHQRWDVAMDDDTDRPRYGTWRKTKAVVPEEITLDGGGMEIKLASSVGLSGERYSSEIVKAGHGEEYWGIRDGSIRVVGYKTGDLVTILGQKDSDGRLVIKHVHGGNREQFVGHLQGSAAASRESGFTMMLGGLIIALLGLLVRTGLR